MIVLRLFGMGSFTLLVDVAGFLPTNISWIKLADRNWDLTVA